MTETEFIQESWDVLYYPEKPRKGIKWERVETVKNHKRILDFSFLKNAKLGWYCVIWNRRRKNGQYAPHPVQDTYQKYREPTGRIVADHWKGPKFGILREIVKRVYFQ